MTTFDSTSADLTDRRSYRTLASAIAVFLGAYLVTSTLSGQLGLFLTGISQPPADVVVLYVLQAIFGIAVVIGGFLLAPGTLGARLIAGALLIAVLAIALDGLFALLQHFAVPRGVTAGKPTELRAKSSRRRTVAGVPAESSKG